MSDGAAEVAIEDEPLARAAENARRGFITHLTIEGERVAAIIPESAIEALGDFAEILRSPELAPRLPHLIQAAIPWTRVLPEDDLPVFAAEVSDAAAAGEGAPVELATVLREWRATAEAYADPAILEALTTPPVDHGPVPEPVR